MLHKNKLILYFLSTASIFFLCSYFTPRMFDDLYYGTFTEGSAAYWENLGNQLKVYYMQWGGRLFAHGLAGVILSVKSNLFFGLVNTFAGVLTIWLLAQITFYFLKQDKKLNGKFEKIDIYFITSVIFFLFAKKPMQTLFWTTGSMNYLWMGMFQLIFLYANKEWLFGNQYLKAEWYKLPLYGFFGFLAGFTNENAGAAMLSLTAFTFYYRWKNGKKIYVPQELVVSFFVFLSTALLIFAPGNAVRKAVVEAGGAPSLLQKLNWFIESFLVFFGRPDGVVLLLIILFVYIGFQAKKSVPPLIKNPFFIKMWILFGAASFIFLGHNGNFYGRSSYNLSLFFILIANFLIFNFLSQSGLADKKHESRLNRLKLFLGVAITAKILFTLVNIVQFKTYYEARDKEIREQIARGKTDIEIHNFRHSQIYDLEDLSSDPRGPVNLIFADHYKVKSVTAKNEKTIPWVKSNR